MSYRFPLAAVLKVRMLAVEQEERTLARIHGELAQLRVALSRAQSDLSQGGSARFQAFSLVPLPAMHLHASYAADADLRDRIGKIEHQLMTFEQLRLQQIVVYQEAYRRREVLASLERAGRDAWQLAEGRAQAKRLDEAFLAKMGRDAREQANGNPEGPENSR